MCIQVDGGGGIGGHGPIKGAQPQALGADAGREGLGHDDAAAVQRHGHGQRGAESERVVEGVVDGRAHVCLVVAIPGIDGQARHAEPVDL